MYYTVSLSIREMREIFRKIDIGGDGVVGIWFLMLLPPLQHPFRAQLLIITRYNIIYFNATATTILYYYCHYYCYYYYYHDYII